MATNDSPQEMLSLVDILRIAQEQTDRAMMDPAFRKAVGVNEDTPSAGKEDPLAADKNGWNLPKTGQVNTTGALQRVNARTGESGVTATADSSGQLTLSNVSNRVAAQSTFNPSGQVGKNPMDMTSLISQLRGVDTTAEASVIMDNIRGTIASEEAKIQKEALNFASGKLGIPAMEQALRQAEMADKADRKWYPGVGDSHITATARTQLGVLRGQANEQANEYLKTNLASGMLKQNLLSATEELRRIDVSQKRKEGISDRATDRTQNRLEIKQEETDILLAQVTPRDKSFLKILNPSLQNDDEAAMGRAIKNLPKDTKRMDALKAASEESGNTLIGLTVEKNADAKTLLIAKEKLNNPSMDIAVFEEKLKRIEAFADNKDYNSNLIALKYGEAKKNSPEAKNELMRMNAEKAPGGDATDKGLARRSRIATAIAYERQNATADFLSNVNRWGVTDPTFLVAVNETISKRGKADFATIVDSYIGTSTGMEAATKGALITSIAREAFGKQTTSVFGRPDESAAMKIVSDRLKSVGIGTAIGSLLSDAGKFAVSDPIFGGFLRGMYGLGGELNKAVNSFKVPDQPR